MISRDYKLYDLSQTILISLKLRDYLEPYLLKTQLLEKYLRILKQNDRKRLCLRTKFQTRHKEVSKTERKINRRPSFHSIDNKYRHAIGLLEVPFLLKEFKSSVKFLYHIAYDKQLSRLCISGHSPKIHVYKYSYNNVFGICNIDSKYETLIVEDEPQGLAIGYKTDLCILTVRTALLR